MEEINCKLRITISNHIIIALEGRQELGGFSKFISRSKLIGQNPYSMYRELCKITDKKFDPCLADVFISAVKFMEGAPPQKWWHYTEERKATLSKS
jgi:hypothetical protein